MLRMQRLVQKRRRTLARTRPPKRAPTQQAERWLKTVIDEVLDEHDPEQ